MLAGRRVPVNQAKRLELVPERTRDRRAAMREIRRRLAGTSHARDDACDRGVMQGELNRSGGQRNAMASAHAFDARGARLDLAVGLDVEERRAIACAGGEDARV